MSLKFRNARAIAKHQLSFHTHPILCALDKAKGLDVGNDYNGDKAFRTFVSFIAAEMLGETEALLKESPFFSFICNGSTDFTGDDYESLYTRTSLNGHVKERFFNIGIAQSASSEHIHDFVQWSVTAAVLENLWETKLVRFYVDNASNMQGNNFDNECFTFLIMLIIIKLMRLTCSRVRITRNANFVMTVMNNTQFIIMLISLWKIIIWIWLPSYVQNYSALYNDPTFYD